MTHDSAVRFSNFDEGWENVDPRDPAGPPDGWFRGRLVAIEPVNHESVRLVFCISDGKWSGEKTSLFLSFARPREAKHFLHALSLDSIKPSGLTVFRSFDELPDCRLCVRRRESNGRFFPNVVQLERLQGRAEADG
ncbi:MAG: hypothetical protein ACF8XB_08865 [Planctomycetota bacterium JB042]